MGWGVSRTHEVLVMVSITNHWTKVLILLTEDFVTIGEKRKIIIINQEIKLKIK